MNPMISPSNVFSFSASVSSSLHPSPLTSNQCSAYSKLTMIIPTGCLNPVLGWTWKPKTRKFYTWAHPVNVIKVLEQAHFINILIFFTYFCSKALVSRCKSPIVFSIYTLDENHLLAGAPMEGLCPLDHRNRLGTCVNLWFQCRRLAPIVSCTSCTLSIDTPFFHSILTVSGMFYFFNKSQNTETKTSEMRKKETEKERGKEKQVKLKVSNREERMTLDHASPVRQGNIEEGERSDLRWKKTREVKQESEHNKRKQVKGKNSESCHRFVLHSPAPPLLPQYSSPLTTFPALPHPAFIDFQSQKHHPDSVSSISICLSVPLKKAKRQLLLRPAGAAWPIKTPHQKVKSPEPTHLSPLLQINGLHLEQPLQLHHFRHLRKILLCDLSWL
ncbi:hypothetical protein VP01_617g1 [Puccinia sorghi]|uniref:Uncharacterized protein n=1 Tax=Puccinia sorghi TaxID=27349 RepID=A0A0L6UGS9_9BASI|nr:hypothetical protein VP01_617g1 [Puccinia sorghi]